jgi:hypothetical protein
LDCEDQSECSNSQILAARGIDTTAVVAEDGNPKVRGFVRAEAAEEPEREEPTHVANPDASEEDNKVSTKVPDSVFGSLAKLHCKKSSSLRGVNVNNRYFY